MPTIIDVAREAGVSFKTVSRVFNGEDTVRPVTREKVREAARRIGYSVNPAARALRSKASRKIGLLLNNPSLSYSETVQIGALLAMQSEGYQLVMLDGLTAFHAEEGLAGVVACPPLANDPDILDALGESHLPFVRVGAERVSQIGDKVGIDDRAAAREMTDYLIKLGHRRIGFIEGAAIYDVSRRRLAGFNDAIHRSSGAVQSITASGDFSYASGLLAAEDLLSKDNRPTAIFAANDEMASACLAAAYKMNLRVPDELSVVGFDDSPVSRAVYPAITTVRQGVRDLLSASVDILSGRMSGDTRPAHDIIHAHEVIVRDSAGPPPE